MAEIVLINPRYSISFWGMEHSLPIFRKRANMPMQSLPLLAALAGPEHTVTIVDENVEELDFNRLARADMVGVTGMNVQRVRMRQICEELHARGIFTVVGGAWVTVEEDYFEGVADAIFVGEADQSWPLFLRQWQAGEHQYRYEQTEPTLMERLPVPRLDLLKTKHYMFGTLQISRGCPYQCEFCDIIVTFGRRPRLKTGEQITAELDSLLANGLPFVFVVDDNLIGNKKAVKQLLPHVIRWQEAHGYPMTFFTEASIDLAEDEELMGLLARVNCQSVFVGIESPNEDALVETKKSQNLRKGAGTLLERVHRIQDFGLDIWCGMIVGFDSDDATIFEVQKRFLTEARIAQAMVGMLGAIPKTPLYERLQEEGRLDPDDAFRLGTNFEPAQMTREELSEGYVQLMHDLYQPQAFFDRLDALYLDGNFRYASHYIDYWRRKPWQWFRRMRYAIMFFVGAAFMLLFKVKDATLRRTYRRRLLRLMWKRWEPEVWFIYVLKSAGHYHFYLMAEEMKKHGAINHGTDEHYYAAANRPDSHIDQEAGLEPAETAPDA
jgi:radical SAM superfamily enzyme YgiQ (UPF0313 family)